MNHTTEVYTTVQHRMPIFIYKKTILIFIEPINILINDSHLASGILRSGNHTSIPRLSLSWLVFATSDEKREKEISGFKQECVLLF